MVTVTVWGNNPRLKGLPQTLGVGNQTKIGTMSCQGLGSSARVYGPVSLDSCVGNWKQGGNHKFPKVIFMGLGPPAILSILGLQVKAGMEITLMLRV